MPGSLSSLLAPNLHPGTHDHKTPAQTPAFRRLVMFRSFLAPLFVSGLILGALPTLGDPGQGVKPTPAPEQGVKPPQQLPEQGVTPAPEQGVKPPQQLPEQGVTPTQQGPVQQQAEQGRANQQQQGLGQPEQGTVQGQQGSQETAQQASLPKDMPKMIVIRAQKDKTGAEVKAEIFPVDKTVKVNNQQAAQEMAKQLEQQQGVEVQEPEMGQVPAQIRQLFQSTDGGSQMLDWGRWHYWNRGLYGYGYRNYYGYGYPRYYGNYGYYYGGVTYPYTYNNWYYPYGGYNYYYYYNPYYYY